MSVNAGTAYVRVSADFSTFNREMSERLKSSVTQKVNVDVDQQSLQRSEDKVRGHASRIGGLLKGALAGIGTVGAVEYISHATESVNNLFEGAMKLHSIAGLSRGDALQWVSITQAMGISSQKLTVTFKTLDTQFQQAQGGSKKSQQAFKDLGISQKELNATGGDSGKIFQLVNEHLAKMPASAKKTADEFKLLGRGAAALNPLLADGGEEFKKLQKFAGSLGITLSDNTTKNIEKARDAQFKFKLVMEAAQLFVVNKLIPALLDFGKFINQKVVPPVKELVGHVTDFVKTHPELSKTVGEFVVLAGAAERIHRSAAGGALTNMLKALTGGGIKALGGSGGGALGKLVFERGSNPANPLYVFSVNGGGGSGILPKVAGGVGAAETIGGLTAGGFAALVSGAVAEGILLPASMDLLPKLPGPQSPRVRPTASNPQGIPEAGFQNRTLNFGPPPKTVSNPQGISLFLPHGNGPVINIETLPLPGSRSKNGGIVLGYDGTTELIGKPPKGGLLSLLMKPPSAQDVNAAMGIGPIKRLDSELGNALQKTHNVASKSVKDILLTIGTMPAGMRKQAGLSMIGLTQELERQGKLPLGSTKKLIKQIEQQFPQLTDYLKDASKKAAAAFDLGKGMQKTRTDVKHSLDKMKDDFPEVTKAMETTRGGVEKKSAAVVTALQGIIKNGTGPMKRKAKADLAELVTALDTDMGHMVSTAQKQSPKFRDAVSSNSHSAFQIGSANFKGLAQNIAGYIGSGAEATKQGLQNITDQVNGALKSFGEAKLSSAQVKALTPGQLAALISGQISSGAAASPHATGGLIQVGQPGAAGVDNIPMNVGGQPITVGSGEQVAVLNRHQQKFLNTVLSPIGGMSGMFDRVRTPHYMAQGGIVGKPYAAGGYVYPLPGFSLGRTDMGVDASASAGSPIGPIGRSQIGGIIPNWYAGQPYINWKLLDGPAAGRWVYVAEQITGLARPGAMLNATDAVARFASSGTGIEMGWSLPGAGANALASSHYHEGDVTVEGTSFRSFISGLSHGKITGLAGGSGGGTGATWHDISVPQVSGRGVNATLARGALRKAVAAANAFGRKKAGQASGGTGTGTGGSTAGLRGNEMQIVRQLAQRFGWTNQIADWAYVLNRESNGTLTDTNPSSGAYGLAQFINGPSEYYKYGGNPNTYAGQLLAMANYIKQRYGSPAAAAAHERANNWYAKGGIVPGFAGGGFIHPKYESKLQKRFADTTRFLKKMWKVASPSYHQANKAMPPITYTQGKDGLFVGVDATPGFAPGHRQLFLPDWVVTGQGAGGPGLDKRDATMLQLMLHEWTHEFQRADIINRIKTPKTGGTYGGAIDAFEGGAQSNALKIAPMVLGQLGIHNFPRDWISYKAERQWVDKNLGDNWVRNKQFGYAGGGWVRTGATIDPTRGQAPTYSDHGGYSFAELLEAGRNRGRRPDLTQLLGLHRGAYGMQMETPIHIRMPGRGSQDFKIWKNDVGSGQPSAHYTIDLHQAIANALGWHANQDVEVSTSGGSSSSGGKSSSSKSAAKVNPLVNLLKGVIPLVKKQKKPKALPKLPILHPAPLFGDMGVGSSTAQTFIDDMNNQVNGVQPRLDRWSGLISSIRGVTGTVSPLVQDANGNDILNPGLPTDDPLNWNDLAGYAIGQLTGLKDPTTNELTKGIKDRLREIGTQQDRLIMPFSVGSSTDLGILETELDSFVKQQSDAGTLVPVFGRWMAMVQAAIDTDTARSAWLGTATDEQTPWDKVGKMNFADLGKFIARKVNLRTGGAAIQPSKGKIPHYWNVTETYDQLVHQKVHEFKNKSSIISYLSDRKKQVEALKKSQAEDLLKHTDKLKENIDKAGSKKTFGVGSFVNDMLGWVHSDEMDAKKGVDKPKDWLGDNSTWGQVANQENREITREYGLRRAAIKAIGGEHKWSGHLDKKHATSAVDALKGADSSALSKALGQYNADIGIRVGNADQIKTTDMNWLTALRNNIITELGDDSSGEIGMKTDALSSGGMKETLDSYTDQFGDLGIQIQQLNSVDIPQLLNEVQLLTNTVVPKSSSTSSDQTGLADLQATMLRLKNEASLINVLQQQVLKDAGFSGPLRIPFGGSFADGGVVPGAPGAPIMIQAHGGEVVSPHGGTPEVYVNISGDNAYLRHLINVEIEQKTRGQARTGIREARLPSTRGYVR